MKKKIITYIAVAILSALFIMWGNSYFGEGAKIFKHSVQSAEAKVLTVDSIDKTENDSFTSSIVILSAEIIRGDKKGEVVKAYQEHNSMVESMSIAEAGDKIIIKNYPSDDLGTDWVVDNYRRTPQLILLAVIFTALVIIFGRSKGLRTIISLIFTCLSVFCIFIPSVLSGKNIYFTSILICIFIIVMTLLLINGPDKKTLCASLGCIGGVLGSALLTIIMSRSMKFAGYINEDSYYLTMLDNPVNLKAIAFAAVIIGAVGAVMDVAMSLSSSLFEIKEKVPDITFKSLISSGFEIGRDMIGTMANTLILAYIGSSVSCVLLLLTYADSIADVLNREMIAYEILQAIAGSLGILLAVPLTTIICGLVYLNKKKIPE